jgi:hypothetical protein
MSRDIKSGIEQLVAKSNQNEQYNRSWRDLRNKLDSSLMLTNVLKGDAIRKLCLQLDSLNKNDRYKLIHDNWGVQQAEKSRTLLEQLDIIEREISKNNG